MTEPGVTEFSWAARRKIKIRLIESAHSFLLIFATHENVKFATYLTSRLTTFM